MRNFSMNYQWSIVLAMLVLQFTGIGMVNATAISLTANGQAKAVIVIPQKAPAPVKFAAEEIKYYLNKISGSDIKIVHKIPQSAAIILGAKLSKKAGIQVDKIKRDGYEIKTIGNKIYIAGKDDETEKSKILFSIKDGSLPEKCSSQKRYLAIGEASWDFERGTLHGAYDFLERLGVRWFFAGPKGEIIPTIKNILIFPIDVIEQPAFELRIDGMITWIRPKTARKNGLDPIEYKMLGWTEYNQRLWLIRNRASSKWMAFNHRPVLQQWSKRFGKSNPEYFALQKNSERATKRHCYLNYTSEGMLQETVKDMNAFFTNQRPESRGIKSSVKFKYNNGWAPTTAYGNTFSLLPNDGLRTDQSPKSQKFLYENRPFPFRHTNYIWQFVKKAAKKLKKSHPDKFITCLAYQTYWEVPDRKVLEKLPDNVIVGIAALSGFSRVHTFMRKKQKKKFIDLLGRWSKITSTPFLFWDYWLWRYNQPGHKNVPMLLPHGAQDFVKTRFKYGKYMYMQHDVQNLVFEHLNRYVMHRLLWNPDVNVDAILDDYCEKFYGPASEIMRSMFTKIEKKCFKIAQNNADFIAIWENYFNEESLKKYRLSLLKAKKLCKGMKYEANVNLISKWFIAPMESARNSYVKNVKALVEKGKNVYVSLKTPFRAMKIDGKMTERPWTVIGGKWLVNNANGRYTKEMAKIRIRHSDKSLFFFYDIHESEARNILKNNKKDSVEIFLDTNNDRETYYWLYIPMDGKAIERFYPGPGEPPNDWTSDAKIAINVTDKGWRVEVEIPFKSLELENKNLEEIEIGALCCLTRRKHFKDNNPDKFSTSNPILRGSFHQPGAFGKLRFMTPQVARKMKKQKGKK